MNAHNDINSLSRANYNLDRLVDNTRSLSASEKIVYGSQAIGINILENDNISFKENTVIGFKVSVILGSLTIEVGNNPVTLPEGRDFSIEPLYDYNQKCWNKIEKSLYFETGSGSGNVSIITIYKPQETNE